MQREAFEDHGDPEHRGGPPDGFRLAGMTEFFEPLQEGQDSADGEEEDGHHERPEVSSSGETERVRFRGFLLGLVATEEQEPWFEVSATE
jgi:hypothetical protein